MIVVKATLRTPLAKPGPKPGKLTTPKAAATPKLTAMITAGPTTAIKQPLPSPRVESHPRPNRASLTARNDERHSERHRDHGTAILISGAIPACGSARAMASVNAYVMHRNTTT